MKQWIALFFMILCATGCAAPIQRQQSFPSRIVAPLQRKMSSTPIVTPPLKISNQLIVIDAGHGGEDDGTSSLSTPRYKEKSLTLMTSKLLKTYLQQMGYQVKMTRTEDVFVALDKRAIFANAINPALFVSVHYNSAPSTDASGIEIYYYKTDEDETRAQSSRKLAEAVLKRVIQNTEAKSRGVRHGNFAVIRETKVPAILIEGGFMTNQEEMVKIKDPEYIKKLAWGMAQGIADYLK